MFIKKFVSLIIVIIIVLLLSTCQYFELLSYKDWLNLSGNQEVDIYISGILDYTIGAGGTGIACYWKIGENNPIYLENGNLGQANDIFISGNNIYICGTYNGVYESGTQKACYWKNGDFVELESPSSISLSILL